MSKEFIVTPEVIESIKALAYTGMSKEDIANALGRDRNTVFYNSAEYANDINSAYLEGKDRNKKELLDKAAELTEQADSDSVKLSAIKYNLAIKHKVVETQKIESELSGAVVVEWANGNQSNDTLSPTPETTPVT